MIAVVGVLVFGILKGVLIAAVTSLVLLIKDVTMPHVAFLGRIPGTIRFSDLNRHPDNETIPGVLLFRVEASWFYFNVDFIYNKVWSKIQTQDSSIKRVICDLSTSPYVDRAGAAEIRRLYLNLKARGISFRIAEAHAEVRDMLRSENIEYLLGHISRKDTVDELVEASVKDLSPFGLPPE